MVSLEDGPGDITKFSEEIETTLAQGKKELESSTLPEKYVQEGVGLIDQVKSNLHNTLPLVSAPGRKMELADAAAEALLEKTDSLGDTRLVNEIWEGAMAMNDYLITSDPGEIEAFDEIHKSLLSHPQSATFQAELEEFRGKSHEVFEAQTKLQDSMTTLISSVQNLSNSMLQSEEEYSEQVVDPLNEKVLAELAFLSSVTTWAVVLLVIASLVIGWLVSHKFLAGLKSVNTMLEDIAQGEGDLTKRLNYDGHDEIGTLVKNFNIFVEKIRNIIVEVSGNTATLVASSEELTAISREMVSNLEAMTEQSHSAAAGTEELSTNIRSVSASFEQTSSNMSNLASSSEAVASAAKEIDQLT
ncbi:MAG: methyl-accepting chemotaxis protein, partial [Candidatus Omnitrophica bacterium]|nr:methyl-accepting chemotaxis protein [Candidatus Omnitrophota bacterium]